MRHGSRYNDKETLTRKLKLASLCDRVVLLEKEVATIAKLQNWSLSLAAYKPYDETPDTAEKSS